MGLKMTRDFVVIYNDDLIEIAYWKRQDWEENPALMLTIAWAIDIYHTSGTDAVRRYLEKLPPVIPGLAWTRPKESIRVNIQPNLQLVNGDGPTRLVEATVNFPVHVRLNVNQNSSPEEIRALIMEMARHRFLIDEADEPVLAACSEQSLRRV